MNKDSWETPQWLYDELNEEFNFGIDLCATRENSKCQKYCTDYLNNKYQELGTEAFLEDGELQFNDINVPLEKDWYREDIVCFMNPPYSNPYPFVKKAWEDSKYCKIVLVLPAKTDTKWWSIFWQRDYCEGCEEDPCINDSLSCQHKPNHHSGPKPGCDVKLMPYKSHHKSRVAFVNPETGKEQRGNPCGTCIVIFDRRGE